MSFYNLYRDVISNHLCTDCGACMLVCPADVIYFEQTIMSYEPKLKGKCLGEKCSMCIQVCPGAHIPQSEIEKKLLGRRRDRKSMEDSVGVTEEIYVGQWDDDEILQVSGSGGVVTGLLVYAMETGLIDGAVVTGPHPEKPWLSQAVLATSPSEIIENAGSRYDSFPQLMALQEAEKRNLEKIAIVTLGCHANALRKMELAGRKYRQWTDRIQFIFGLWCVGNFCRNGIEYLIEQRFGIPLNEVASLIYRIRPFPGQMTVTRKSGEKKSELWVSRYTYHLLARSFYLDACRQCTDGFADLADISFGDPWGYKTDKDALKTGIGYSCSLVRTRRGHDLMKGARKAGMFRYFEKMPAKDRHLVAKTTPALKVYTHGCFNNERKRHGLPVRVVE